MNRIVLEFGSELSRRAGRDKVLRRAGVPRYVGGVLVPELVVMLIKEDMKVRDEEARQILQESASLGETLHGDV
jgi:hypothetical protein